jgi:hypothetical protein
MAMTKKARNMNARLKWEDEVYDAIERDWDVSRSDAQGIVEANSDVFENAWARSMKLKATAQAIMG